MFTKYMKFINKAKSSPSRKGQKIGFAGSSRAFSSSTKLRSVVLTAYKSQLHELFSNAAGKRLNMSALLLDTADRGLFRLQKDSGAQD